jgi:hypothetical protein
MVASWPDTLPPFMLIAGYSEGEGDGLLEYQPDTGPAITRLRSSASPRPLAGAMLMTAEQRATFRNFFATDIGRGALPFMLPDQAEEGTLLVKFTKSGLPRWSSPDGLNWQMSFELMVLP